MVGELTAAPRAHEPSSRVLDRGGLDDPSTGYFTFLKIHSPATAPFWLKLSESLQECKIACAWSQVAWSLLLLLVVFCHHSWREGGRESRIPGPGNAV